MANVSGIFTSSVQRIQQPYGFCFSQGNFRRSAVCWSGVGDVRNQVSHAHAQPNKIVSKGCKLVGCGSAVPSLSVSNDDLAKIVDTSDEWISTRTGIRNRRILSGNESLRSLAVEAAKKALEMADVEPDDLDLILMCTSTPENLFGDAPQVQRELGCTKTPIACDIRAACSGFVLGLFSAACYVRGGGLQNILVIGADAVSRFTDWTDRGTCVLFGDAAGAVVVQACGAEEDGLISFDLHSDGEGGRHLGSPMKHTQTNDLSGFNGSVLEFPSIKSSYPPVQMNGQEVFRFAVRSVPKSIESALKKANLTASDIDWLLLHQANQRIIDAVATRLEFLPEKVISNVANYGNTSAASIPLALDEAVRSGKVKRGHTIAAAGFGAGPDEIGLQVHDLLKLYDEINVPPERFLFKIPSTRQLSFLTQMSVDMLGIEDSRLPESEGIQTHVTFVYSFDQDAAADQAGASVIQIFVGRVRLTKWDELSLASAMGPASVELLAAGLDGYVNQAKRAEELLDKIWPSPNI